MDGNGLFVNIANPLLGLLLLTLGRKLFWLFVACVGFVAGFTYSGQFLGDEPGLLPWIIAMALGCLGAILAVFLQRVAAVIAGFLAGGYIAVRFVAVFHLGMDELLWVMYLLGGAIGSVLLFSLFDWALIVLSSLAGAALLVEVAKLGPMWEMGLFSALFILGFLFQVRLMQREQRPDDHGSRA